MGNGITSAIFGTIVGVGLGCVFFVALGVVFVYCKLVKFGKAMASFLTDEEEQEFREGMQTSGGETGGVPLPSYAQRAAPVYVNQEVCDDKSKLLAVDCLPTIPALSLHGTICLLTSQRSWALATMASCTREKYAEWEPSAFQLL